MRDARCEMRDGLAARVKRSSVYLLILILVTDVLLWPTWRVLGSLSAILFKSGGTACLCTNLFSQDPSSPSISQSGLHQQKHGTAMGGLRAADHPSAEGQTGLMLARRSIVIKPQYVQKLPRLLVPSIRPDRHSRRRQEPIAQSTLLESLLLLFAVSSLSSRP